ncbi:non-ribosomal peptide synthase/polyketide synthase [Sorangium sp. So ce1389]|uniref:non-ribosomal peptide synthase/polyketide synthase n=1 Tax=Sorangium sp. So ce1389 TaxID=3133336 RepID=UPI003F5D941F
MEAKLDAVERAKSEPIAIVGAGCRFPGGADSPEEFWRLLTSGVDAIGEVPPERWSLDAAASGGATPEQRAARWGAFLKGVDLFDADFFSIAPREAVTLDPQQRILLEVAWEALENAGIVPAELMGSRSGVFLGITYDDYRELCQQVDPEALELYAATGNGHCFPPGRISYVLGLNGPSLAVDTACSSSLVAVHMACNSLRRGECSLALAGGISLMLTPTMTNVITRIGALAPDGRCKTFDARANGFVRGEGCGVVVLKRLSDALRDGDPILALLRGSAVTQDGRSAGLTAPSPAAQKAMLVQALENARVSPSDITFIETHGTGTSLGDPIEFEALAEVLGQARPEGSSCVLGALKTNIGHLEPAAGVAGLIKTVLALQHEEIPPNLHFKKLNPRISLEGTPFVIPAEPVPWKAGERPRLAGVSAFGMSGTNAHVVVEEAPPRPAPQREAGALHGFHLLPLSARSPGALRATAEAVERYLAALPEEADGEAAAAASSLADVCYTASVRRGHHEERLSVVGRSRDELRAGLQAFVRSEPCAGLSTGQAAPGQKRRLVFVFSGQGSQWVGMGRQLLAEEPIFRGAMERCDALLREHGQISVIDELRADAQRSRLDDTEVTQPALFALQVSLVELWRALGVAPDAVVGHSVGEVAAAYAAGALSLEQAARIVAHRGRVMQGATGLGRMAAVELSIEEAERTVAGYAGRLSLAAVNSPTSAVLAGEEAALVEVLDGLKKRDVFCRLLNVNYAFHSHQMEPLKDELARSIREIAPRAAAVPMFSSVSGQRLTGVELTADYWVRNMREPVRFAAAMKRATAEGYDVFLEVGPHPVLGRPMGQCLNGRAAETRILASLRNDRPEPAMVLESLGALYTLGVPVAFRHLHPAGGRCVSLPTYRWQRDRYWYDPPKRSAARGALARGAAGHPLLGAPVALSIEPETHLWEAEIGLAGAPYLADHRVQGALVLPAAAYVDMALAAAEAVFGREAAELTGLTFKQALFLPEKGTRSVQITLTRETQETASLRVSSLAAGATASEGTWQVHAAGTLALSAAARPREAEPLDAIRERCKELRRGPEHYEGMAKRGLEYGPCFQGIIEVARRDGEALAEVRLSDEIASSAGAYRIHPALLDACLQALITTLPQDGGAETFLPTGFDRVRLFERPGAQVHCHVRLRGNPEERADRLVADLALLNEDGELVVEVEGFQGQRIDQSSAQLLQNDIGEWVYELTWASRAGAGAAEAAVRAPFAEPGTWILFADEGGVARGLAERLAAQGQRPILVARGADGALLGDELCRIDPTRADAMQELIAFALSADRPACRGILHLWSLDARTNAEATAAELEAAQAMSCTSVVHLLQALGAQELREPPRLWLVTQGAQGAGDHAAPRELAQAPLWGLGRTVRHEYPSLASRLVDLDPDGDPPRLVEQLWGELLREDGEDQIALRGEQRLGARLERRRALVEKARAPRLRPDASYLITGGLGGIGLAVARWMVELGARRLILMGRSALPARSRWKEIDADSAPGRQIAAIRALEARGASVHLAAVDIADEERLASFLEQFEAEGWPEIRGVMHAAGLLDDRLIARLDAASFLRVLGPKVKGAWQLQRLFAGKPLDFFVLFSSAAAVLGSAGQANYAAANAFLDALAPWMRAQGRSALSIDWGAWAEVGMAAKQENRGGRLASRGILGMAPERALGALGRLLRADAAHVGVMAIDWRELAQHDPVSGASALLERLMRDDDRLALAGAPQQDSVLAEIRETTDAEERRRKVEAHVRKLTMAVLRVPESRLTAGQRLSSLGFDSLMALELKGRVERDLGVALPMVRFLEGPSTGELAAQLLDALQIVPPEAAAPAEQPEPPRAQDAHAATRLSYGQQALWFLHKLAPESTAYNLTFALKIGAGLSVASLRHAFQRLVDRHSPLRTTYVMHDGEAALCVPERADVHLDLVDATAWSPEQLRGRLTLEAGRPFDLEHGPVMRVQLFARPHGEHILLLSIHHIAADFWSFVVLIEELGLIYTADKNGEDIALPPLSASYADFTRWQAEMLASAEGEGHWAYWKEQLRGDLPALNLTTDRPRPPVQTYRGASHAFSLSAELSQQLKTLARVEGTTIYTLLLTAFQILLHRMTGQDDILVGSPAAGRSLSDLAPLVGYFVNLVVLRARLEDEPSFREALARMHQTVLGAIAHQDFPFPLLVERLQPPRDPGRSPIFQVAFVLQKPHRLEEIASFVLGESGANLKLGELAIESVALPERVSQFDLTLMMVESDGALHASLQYNTDLFDAATMGRMAGHFQALLAGIVAEPERSIRKLPLLSDEERRRALEAWNATEADYPRDACLHDLFEQQAARSPDAVAVIYQDRQMSYRELNRRANQLGRELRRRGARPNTLVAIVLDKGWEQVVAALAILKAGAAYVPIDPNLPEERVRHLLTHGQVEIALTRAALDERLSFPDGVARLCVDAHEPTDADDQDLDRAQSPGDLAYVIYTSGSTGLPKGVMIDHTGPVNTVVDVNRRFRVSGRDRVLAISALNFDLSVYDVFGMLAAGGALVLPEASAARDPGYWAELIARWRVTIWNSVPALMEMLVNHAADRPGARLSSLRAVLMSGDWIPVPLPDRIKRLVPGVAVISMGGATEASIWSIIYPIDRVDPAWRSVPYGRPMDNQRFYVLDESLEPCPIGAAGALYIGGIGVAQGYWRDEELTRAAFITHPRTGERLYRTGDLGRYMPDGVIEFLGRKDFQVKVRGFRIELGEIEATLLSHPTVREAAATVREDTPGDRRLVAYVVAAEGERCAPAELRGFLKEKLPEYMVPAVIMALDAMPLSANGKVDRKALPAPERPEVSATFVAPRSPVEEALAAIWASVLGLEKVGVDDNFFTLGGDSILAIQVVSRAQQADIGLLVRQMFQHQTIASLATVATAVAAPRAEQGLVTGAVPLTPIQRWFFERELAEPHHFNQAVLLEVREPLDPARLDEALQHLRGHHDALRLRFERGRGEEGQGGWRQRNADLDGPLPLTVLDLSAVPAEGHTAAIEQAASALQASLELGAGPLMKVALMHLGPSRPGRLLLVAHHLVVDGVSWRILIEDLNTAYDQLCQGQPVALPSKTSAFKQWAERLVEHAGAAPLLQQLPFWASQAGDLPALPVDRRGGDNTVGSSRSIEVCLDAEATRALLFDVPEVYRTQINDVLLSALGLALAPWTGARCLRLDLEGHGREPFADDLDVSRTVGWFTSMFPVALRLPDAGIGEVLKSVKEQLRALPDRGFGHGLLRYLHPDPEVQAALRSLPPGELLFNYLGQLDQMLAGSSRFEFARESSGPTYSPRGARSHLLEINGWVAGAELHLLWTYSEEVHHRATIEALAQRMVDVLRDIIAHCQSAESGGHTPADFPLAALTQAEVDRLTAASRALEDIYPLSPTQLGMLFHTVRDPASGDYVEQLTFRSPGGLQVDAFKEAWQKVIARHTIFRTSFAWEGLARPLQIVHGHVPLPWTELDWRGVPAREQEERLASFLEEDRRRGFDLAAPPLMRFTLVRLSDEAYQFVWSHHHLVVDGWSLPLIFKDLLGFHDAACRGEILALPAPRPYREYIAWVERRDLAAAEAYWREALRGFHAPTPLVVDRLDNTTAPLGRGHVELERRLPAALTAALTDFVRAHGLTLNTLIQGAWALLLGRYSGEPDVVFGSTVSGRSGDLGGIESMVGIFINTLPVRVRISPDAAVVPWLQEIQQQQAEQLLHESSPLAQVQRWSELPRGQSLFETLLVIENYPMDAALRQGRTSLAMVEPRVIEQTNYPITVVAIPGDELSLRINYATELFGAATIERTLAQLHVLLEGIVAGPALALRDLPLLPAEERRAVLSGWNDTAASYPGDLCLHELFEAQVERTPDAIAVVFEDQRLTYRALNEQSNRLARHLRSLGVGPDTVVGLCVERSLEMILGVFAVLKAGGAYVPLDPSYPEERLAFMIEDTRAPVLLTQRHLAPRLPAHGARVLCLDAAAPDVAGERASNLPRGAAIDDLAYVIYTSGSTGKPKGVMISHRGITNHMRWMQTVFPLTGEDRILQKTAFSFDAAGKEIFASLLNGAQLVMARPEGHRDGAYLVRAMAEQGITFLQAVPSLLKVLLDEEGIERCRDLRWVFCAGEALSLELTERLFARLPGVSLVNTYGPTEASIDVTYWACPKGEPLRTVPIGRPMANTRAYVLDQRLAPLPIGVPGELHVASANLARGYLARPDLTAERFIPDPFALDPGGRMYKTGDLCRWLPDGTLEFLGRIDHQIKLRGFRIELGEIEAALEGHPAVRQAAAVVREDTPGVKRLVAYLVARDEQAPSIADLRQFLGGKLPDYMVPAVFVVLDAMPLTPSGKVDRKLLPAPDGARPELDDSFVAPEGPAEEALAAVWAHVLGLERVGTRDNFFTLGGDSILAIQVVSRAQQAGIGLSVRQLFDHPTIAALAAVATTAVAPSAEQDLVTGPVPLTPIQRWFFERELVDPHHFNQAVLLEVREPLDHDLLEEAVQHLVRHHDALRLRFDQGNGDGGWRQQNEGAVGRLPVAVVHLSKLSPAEQARAMEVASTYIQSGLRLDRAPLIRVAFMDLGPQRHGRLLIVAHHLAIDGVSWRILLEDLETAYAQLSRGEAVRLPFKTTSFKTWSERLLAHARSESVRRELPFWLSLSSPPAALPVDLPGGHNTMASAKRVEASLSVEETRALLQDVPQAYRTQINDVLLTALGQAFAPWTGSRRLRVDLEGHGREEFEDGLDVSRTIGWFTTLFPVDLTLPERPVGEVLKAVKEQLRQLPSRGFGHGLLRYLSQDAATEEQLRALPRPEVTFNYLGQFDPLLSGSARFSMAGEPSGEARSPRGARSHLLDIEGWILGGQLRLSCIYSGAIHHRATIEALAERMLAALRAIIAHCKSAEAGGRTPADFPLAALSQSEVDRLAGSGRSVEDIYALSPAQLGMLFHTLEAPGSGVYVEHLTCRIPRDLDVEAFKQAWRQVVARHAALRATFVWEGVDQPVQLVHAKVELPFIERDWRGVPGREQGERLEALIAEDRARGFDLGAAPLMRLTLIRLSEEAYQLLWSHHHLLMDGWSLPVVLKEVFSFYEAARRGEALHLPPPRPYRDYIAWLRAQDMERAEAYWRQALRGFHAPTPLVVDSTGDRAGASGEAYRRQTRRLPEATTEAIYRLGRAHGLTINTIFQGAWALLLSRYSGERDVVFGTTVSGRSARVEGIEGMVGNFINTMPVRAQLVPGTTLLDWLKQLQSQQAEQLLHEHTPLAQVQGFSELPRGKALFQSLLVLENYPMDAALRQGDIPLHIEDVRVLEQTNYPLNVEMAPDQQMLLRILYETRSFDEPTVTRMLGHLQTILEAIAGRPDAAASALQLLTAEERRQMVVSWNDSAAEYPRERCFPELFEDQAARTPDALAAVFEDQRLTYRELNGRANHLAHQLRGLGVGGVGPDVVVALLMDRGVELLVAILAVFKAGGAYLPLDPEHPAQRLLQVLGASRAAHVLITSEFADKLTSALSDVPAGERPGIWPVEELSRRASSSENPPSLCGPRDLAYVIYTSGSTGVPKGAMVEHRGMLNHLYAKLRDLEMSAGDALAQTASQCFDISVWQLLSALLVGGRVHIFPNDVANDPRRLLAQVESDGISILEIVPSLLRMTLEDMASSGITPPPLATLRWLMLTGEALPPELSRQWFKRYPSLPLMNAYGPTECSDDVAHYPIHAPPGDDAVYTPIGRPIINTQLYVLDRDMHPLPVGVPGELYVGGDGVGRGYLNDPKRTSEAFLPDPFVNAPGARLYRTGDLVRFLPSGDIEFLGRIDHQVKIRGFRIELGEIEATLEQHPLLREAVVVARELTPGTKRLVAYLVAREAQTPTLSELRSFLEERLPDYMVPAAFVTLPSMPLTPNGKVDRKALPEPDGLRPELDGAFVAPSTPVEQTLARVWTQVLGVARVGVHDDFFALGGDSIIAIQVVSKAQQAGLRVTVRQIFQAPTVAALAAVAAVAPTSRAEQGLVTGPVLLTPIQRSFLEQGWDEPHHFNQAVLLETREALDTALLERALGAVLRHHDALRLRFAREGAAWRQWSADLDGSAPLAPLDLSAVPPGEQAREIERRAAEAQASLRLDEGPLVRAALMDLGAGRAGRLLMVIHHLAVDLVSWRILLEDLETAYAQLQRGEPVRLPPKTTSYQRWAEWLSAYAQSAAVQQDLPHWLAVSGGPRLPVDEPAGANTVASARTVEVSLGAEETEALLKELPEAYRTQINDVLLSALVEAFAPWTGARSLCLDFEGHGREELADDIDLSRTVGWFTALFPVLLELPDAPPGEVLKAAKEQLRRTPGRGLSHGLLRYMASDPGVVERMAARPPAEVSFNFLGEKLAASGQAFSDSALFGLARESAGPAHSPRGLRSHLLEIDGWVAEGRLRMAFIYSENVHRPPTIEALGQRFIGALRALIAHCRSPEAGGRTPADFPLAALTQAEVDRLVGTGRGVEDLYPLSPMQQGMLFHSLHNPTSGVYVEQMAIRIEGGLDVPVFKKAWQQVVDRYPILRSTFAWDGLDRPVQIVRSRATAAWVEQDFRGIPPRRQAELLDGLLAEDRARGFDLGAAPLLRFALIRSSDDTCHFVWTFHHLLMDGWSLPILFKDLLAFYGAGCRGEAVHLSAPRPFRDYIAWLERQDLSRAEAYWREALRGFDTPTPLVVDSMSRKAASTAGAYHEKKWLLRGQGEALAELGRAHGLTLNTIMLGAWSLLLSRYSGERDVVFGTTVSGRSEGVEGIDAMVGILINTLPVRVKLSPEEPVVEWLKRLQEEHAERLAYEYSPLAQVQRWAEIPRNQDLFSSLLVVENYPMDAALAEAGNLLKVTEVRFVEQTNYPLTVVVVPGREGVAVQIMYMADLFEAATIERIFGHLRTLLEAVAADPSLKLGEAPILTSEERRDLLVRWNDTAADLANDACLHEMFEAQAARTPEATAVISRDVRLTYREVNRRANRLGRALRGRGAHPNTLVAVVLEKGWEQVVAALAIQKAGAAYLPIDPNLPAERVRHLLAHGQVELALTSSALLESLSWPEDVERLPVDTWVADEADDTNLDRAQRPDDLAYVIYTSGSTGVPKGVMIDHRGAANTIIDINRRFDVGPRDRVLALSALNFDLSVYDVFGLLSAGGAVVIPDGSILREPSAWAELCGREGVTLWNTVPALMEMLVDHATGHAAAEQQLRSLRAVLMSGDWIPVKLPDRIKQLVPGIVVTSLGGATEASIWSILYPIEHVDLSWRSIPYGRPMLNQRFYVLDDGLEPCAVGVSGALYIGGVGLAKGYWRDESITRAAFIEHPRTGERLYRTGDLGRYMPDGNIEFLGRKDFQVKIRGFRIELGEVEAALLSHHAVREAVAVVREDVPGDKRLVAYVVAHEEPAPEPAELRSFLKGKLPEYMVPPVIMALAAMPLSPNGKVDRRALPAPDGAHKEASADFVAPRTKTEETLAAIFADVLGAPRVGIHDNFFALGGHSLLATQVVSRIREAFSINLSLQQFFAAATLEQLSMAILEGRAEQNNSAQLNELLGQLEGLSEEEALAMFASGELDSEEFNG